MKPYYEHKGIQIFKGDALEVLKEMQSESVQCCVTSPPYWGLRDYGIEGQLGLEKTPEEYVAKVVAIFSEVRRVLKKDGTLWLNLGDSYNGSGGEHKNDKGQSGLTDNRDKVGYVPGRNISNLKPKDLVGIPWRVAFALQADGWYLRSDIIWHKPNPMPESVTDRPTKSHEYIFLMSKSQKYYYDYEAVKEQGVGRETYFGSDAYSKGSGRNDSGSYNDNPCAGRNKRSVWTVTTKPYKEAHFATFPPDLITPCIKAGSRKGDVVLDPFGGSMTTAHVSKELNRKAVMIELNGDYIKMGVRRLMQEVLPL